MVGLDVGPAAVGEDAELLHQRDVAQHPRVVQGFLPRLHLSGVEVGLLVVAEAPAARHVRVAALQEGEVLAAYPPLLVPVLAACGVHEEPQPLAVHVVGMAVGVMAAKKHLVRHGASTREEVVEVAYPFPGYRLCEPVADGALAALVGRSVSHG